MDQHLRSAVREPRFVQTEDGGSVLALALHCVMVEQGFRVTAEKKFGGGASAFSPAADWQGKYTNEWVFDYKRVGYASGFQLHCSLQPGSGKMFVHARETDSPTNMRYMGLLVDKYVPDPAKAKGSSWEGVLVEQEALKQQLEEYVIGPLLAAALPLQDPDDAPSSPPEDWISQLSSYLDSTYDGGISRRNVLLAGAALAAASIGIFFLARSRQQA
ncbi:g4310 [Coccomyxa elongata]